MEKRGVFPSRAFAIEKKGQRRKGGTVVSLKSASGSKVRETKTYFVEKSPREDEP